MNFEIINSSLSTVIAQNNSFVIFLDILKNILDKFFIISMFAFIPGLCGSISILILLKLIRQDKQYNGIKHYYSLIFLTDLIVILIYPINGWIPLSFSQLVRINILWNNESIFYLILCKLVKYDMITRNTLNCILYPYI